MPKRLTIATLPAGRFIDMDEVLLHACFQCLVNFVEQECDGVVRIIDIEAERASALRLDPASMEALVAACERHNEYAVALNELYAWWQTRKLDDDWPPITKGWARDNDVDPYAQWDEDTAMLTKLVKYRGGMWT